MVDVARWRWYFQKGSEKGERKSGYNSLRLSIKNLRDDGFWMRPLNKEVAAGLYMEMEAFWRYELTEGQRARTVRSGMMSSCARLSINILELLEMVMNVCVMMMLRGDGPVRGGEFVMMKGITCRRCTRYISVTGGKRAAGGRVHEAEGGVGGSEQWCFHAKHVKKKNNMLADGLTRWDPTTLLEDLTNRLPEVKGQEQRYKERILAERRGIGDGIGGRADGVHGVLLRGAGKQRGDYNGETSSSYFLSRAMDESLAAVGSYQGEGRETRHKEDPRGGW